MATLTSTKIKNTYDALLKSIDNDAIGSTAKQITDGLGNTTPLYVSTTQVGIGVTPEAGLNLHVYGDAKIGSNLTVIGNLVVEGSTTTVGTDTLTVKDPLIVLANNNTSTDAVDIGFYGKYTPSGTTLYSGLFREALTGKYRLFKGLQIEPTTTVSISGTGYDKADLVIGNIETNGVVEDSSLFTFSKDILINKAGTTKLTIDNVTQNKSIELECTSLNNVLNAEGDMIFSSGSPIFKYTSSSFEVLNVDSTFGGDIIANGDITLSNSSKIKWNGTSALEIYDDGTNAIKIETGSSRILDVCSDIFQLKAGDTNNNDLMLTHGSEGVSIYYRGNTNPGVKFATTSDGVDVTGELAVSGTGQSSFGGQVTIPLTPTSSTDAASKGYVDTQVGANNELSEVLANGNITDGTDIVITAGDKITNFTSTGIDDNATSNVLELDSVGNAIFEKSSGAFLILKDSSIVRASINVTNNDDLIFSTTSSYTTALTIDSNQNSTFAGAVDVNGTLKLDTNGILQFGANTATPSMGVAIHRSAADTLNFVTASTNRLTIDSSGNVGIGATPNSYTGYTVLTLGNTSGSGSILDLEYQTTRTLSIYADTNGGNINVVNAKPLIFYTSALERMRIDSSGKVIINDNAIGDKLLLAGDDAGTARGLMFNCSTTTNQGDTWDIDAQSALGILKFSTGSTPRLTIDSNGDSTFAGTGTFTTATNRILTLDSTTTSGGYTIMSFKQLGTEQFRIFGNHTENYLSFYNDQGTGHQLTLASDGNVGIGTDSPVAPLQIERASNTTLALSNSGSVTSGTRGEIAVYNSNVSTCAAIKAVADTDNVGTELEFYTRPVGGSLTNSMTIESSGNSTFAGDVGIADDKKLKFGDSTDATMQWDNANNEFEINSGADASEISIIAGTTNTYTSEIQIGARSSAQGEGIFFKTRSTERMRITSGGYFKASNNGNYFSSTGTYHELNQTTGGEWSTIIHNDSSAPYGLLVKYSSVSPNNGGSEFYYAADSSSARFIVRSNGGIANFQSNDTNLSDERLKNNIENCDNYLDKICSIPVKLFNYKDEAEGTPKNLGVIAQEVEAIAPELVNNDGFGETPEDGIPLKTVYSTDMMYALMKSIQELKAEIDDLKNKCNCK